MVHLVLNVASSGIASLLLSGGRTAHSKFVVPLSLSEGFMCNISQCIDLDELIIMSKLIIWDEALMTQKHYFEALDKTMRDLLRFSILGSAEKTFGGKTIVLGGNFRHILHVILKATRPVVVGTTINSSYLWINCKVLRLTNNLRLQTLASEEDRQMVDLFSKWIADIRDGIASVVNDGSFEISIPAHFLLHCRHDPISTVVERTFPSSRYDKLDESQLEGRAILSLTLDVVDQINHYYDNSGDTLASAKTEFPNFHHDYSTSDPLRCGVAALLDMEDSAATPHTKNMGLVPPLLEAPCSLNHCYAVAENIPFRSL
ncbi:PREDICTED: uncharacterized protein LOC109184593 [Ipomoea nil]|uniref:uncharacterized protein LOC109184593 n=1 Tax=Ipomoea nil TaxID=35883 RepID=UPI0009019018|nr:PREDICTED: uncharacterized protein LOC109184593 [Ipomoea nil]